MHAFQRELIMFKVLKSENYSCTSEKDMKSCSGASNINGVPGMLRAL